MDRSTGDLHIRQVTTLLRRRWRLISAVTLVGGALVGAAAFLMPPLYTAKAQLLQEIETQDGVAVRDDAAVDTLVELLLSLGQLHKLAASLSGMKAESGLDLPGYEDLKDHLSVFRESRSRVVAITYVSADPHLAATVVNRAVEVYMANASQRLKAEQTSALASVTRHLDVARQHLARAAADVQAFRLAHGISKADGADEISSQVGLMNQQLAITRAVLSAKEAALKSSAVSVATPAKIETASRNFVVEVQPRGLDGDGSTVTGSVPMDKQQLMRERDETKARLGDIEARLETLRSAAAAAETQQAHLRDLERDATAAAEVVQGLTRREADLVARGAGSPSARVVTMATAPSLPSSPNPLLFLLPAILGSALLGSTTALMLERADRRLRSERDVEEMLQVPCIGLVPKRLIRAGDRPQDILPRMDPFAPYMEGVRAVSLAVNKEIRSGKRPRSFLFTASADGDGATTLAVSFALYTARLNQRVLLMDLNFRRPGLAAALGEPEPADRGEGPPGQTFKGGIRKSKFLGIDYMPPPRRHLADPLAVLLKDDFAARMARVLNDYDCIVIDGAPPTVATETRLLSSIVDRILFVVKWGATDARAAQSAIRGLRAQEGHAPISVVIAQADMHLHARYRYGEISAASAAAPPRPS